MKTEIEHKAATARMKFGLEVTEIAKPGKVSTCVPHGEDALTGKVANNLECS